MLPQERNAVSFNFHTLCLIPSIIGAAIDTDVANVAAEAALVVSTAVDAAHVVVTGADAVVVVSAVVSLGVVVVDAVVVVSAVVSVDVLVVDAVVVSADVVIDVDMLPV